MRVQELRPWQHLTAASKMYPKAWTLVEDFRNDRGKGLPDWPSWCFLPMAGWYAIVSDTVGQQRLPLHLMSDVARLAAIGAWRYSQGIYQFEESFYSALTDTPVLKELPVEILFHLPEWSIYIETPGKKWNGVNIYGFWAHLEHDANTERAELRLLIDREKDLLPIPLHIGKWTLQEAIERYVQEARNNATFSGMPFLVPEESYTQTVSEELSSLLPLLLYICSERPDIASDRKMGESPEHAQPKRTKRGWRLFAPDRPRIWTIGKNIGQQLRQAQQEAHNLTRTSGPKPHLRRAHWHGFWTGSRDQQQKFVLKWLPPILVAADNKEDKRQTERDLVVDNPRTK